MKKDRAELLKYGHVNPDFKRTIYVSHSTGYDFKNELYAPIRNSRLNRKYNLILPHEKSDELFSSKEFIKYETWAMIVEASYPKLGVGIEAGLAHAFDKDIITMYKKGFKQSASINSISEKIIEYSSIDEMVFKLLFALREIC